MAGSPDLTVDSPYVAALHSRWELAGDAAALRRAEDEEACRILGADFLHLAVPDCIYRLDPVTGAPLYVSDDDIFGEMQPSEHEPRRPWRHSLPSCLPPASGTRR